MPRIAFALLIVGLLAAGCGAQYWGKPNGDSSSWDRDNYECELASAGVAPTPRTYAPNPGAPGWAGVQQNAAALHNSAQGLGDRAYQMRLYSMCMTARGYVRTSKDGTPVGATRPSPRAVAPAPTMGTSAAAEWPAAPTSECPDNIWVWKGDEARCKANNKDGMP